MESLPNHYIQMGQKYYYIRTVTCSAKVTPKITLTVMDSPASSRQALWSASAVYFYNQPVPALTGLTYSNFYQTFQLNTLDSEWTSERKKFMDT